MARRRKPAPALPLEVRAPLAGRVFAARSGRTLHGSNLGFAAELGDYVVVRTADDAFLSFSHLEAVDVRVGDLVRAGQLLGHAVDASPKTFTRSGSRLIEERPEEILWAASVSSQDPAETA